MVIEQVTTVRTPPLFESTGPNRLPKGAIKERRPQAPLRQSKGRTTTSSDLRLFGYLKGVIYLNA